MSHLVAGLFRDSEWAGKAISSLKEKGYTKDISVISKDTSDPHLKSHDVKKDVTDGAVGGAAAGAVMGAAVGAVATLLVGAAAVVLPGVGILVLGPLGAGLAGAAAGAVTGTLVGVLVDAGFPEEKAKMYEHHIQSGETLVAVSVEADATDTILDIYSEFGAVEVQVLTEQS